MSTTDTVLLAIIPFTAFLSPSYIRTLLGLLKKQPDASASILLFLPIILIAAIVTLSVLTFLFTLAGTLSSQRPYYFLFASGFPDVWPWNTILSCIGAYAYALRTYWEETSIVSARLEGSLCMLLGVSIAAAAGHLADYMAWLAVSIAMFLLDYPVPEGADWETGPPGYVRWDLVVAVIVPAIVVPLVVIVGVMWKVVAKKAAKRKAQEQWVEVNEGAGEHYRDDVEEDERGSEE